MTSTNQTKTGYRNPIVVTALAFGGGMALGLLLIFFLFISPFIEWLTNILDPLQIFLQLLFGILLIFVTVGLGGAAAGAWGGAAISSYSEATTRRKFILRGAISFGITHALLFIPAVALFFLVGFLNQNIDVSFTKLPRLVGVIGVLYGLIGGLIFGLWTAGLKRVLAVVLASAAGFGIGGLLLGLMLRFAADFDGRLWQLLLLTGGFFLFGASGGALLGFVYKRYESEQVFFPDTTFWRFARGAAIILLGFVLLLGVVNIVEFLTIVWPPLAEEMVLPTEGTHWFEYGGVPQNTGLVAGSAPQVTCKNGRVTVPQDGQFIAPDSWPGCFADPVIAQAADGRAHIVYYSDQVQGITGTITPGHYLLESILDNGVWTAPAIIAQPLDLVEPELSSGADKELYLAWEDSGGQHYASMTPYSCEQPPANRISQIVLEAIEEGDFWVEGQPITYCDNRFDRLHFTPNPSSPILQQYRPTPNGAFDTVADVVRNAEYEVLFVTMQWDKPSPSGSPGSTLTDTIADLYEKVKANPEQYPRGMTVRIMLGNLPELAVFSVINQVHYVLMDLDTSGVNVFQDDEIGWKLEIANYKGLWPHAHSKFIVVDGKTAAAAGFNYSYLHLAETHPSGQGLGMTDLALQMTGPIAQSVMAAYDDLWINSEKIDCLAYPAQYPLLLTALCHREETEVTHVPEVLRFYPVESENSAFALHHTPKHLESDAALLAAIGSAQESIDLMEVNFSLETVCVAFAVLSDFCDEDKFAPLYMQALLEAMVERDVKVRAVVEKTAMNGFENRMGIRWLQENLEAAGKEDNLEVKFNANKMHDKAMLIDEEWLSVGSQNFHWSAWGTPSLTEYNIATDDLGAIVEFIIEYNHWWEQGIPAAEMMLNEDILAPLN